MMKLMEGDGHKLKINFLYKKDTLAQPREHP